MRPSWPGFWKPLKPVRYEYASRQIIAKYGVTVKRDEEKEPESSGQPPQDTPEDSGGNPPGEPPGDSTGDSPGDTGEDSGDEITGSRSVGDSEAIAAEEIPPDSELAEALREKDQFRAMAQRAQADFVNFRSRAEAENTDIRRRSVRSILIKVLEVADSIDAALEPDVISRVDQKFVDGVDAINRSFESFLSGEGVVRFDSVGEKFDPRLHEALMRTETDDHPSETVIRVMRAGYKIGDDVLRPALVEVAVPPAASASEEGEATDAEQE